MIPVVAIDGPVGVGKSTVAAMVAERLGFRHLDTGAMYRCVALKVLRQTGGGRPSSEMLQAASLSIRIDLLETGVVLCDGEDVTAAIRDEKVSRFVSNVADHRAVREALVREQRRMGSAEPAVLEGRDIGTVVFPDAACKIYLDGAPWVRAERRIAQLEAMGKSANREEVFRNLVERDSRDRARKWGALRVAKNACVIDTTRFTQERVVELISAMVLSIPLFLNMRVPA